VEFFSNSPEIHLSKPARPDLKFNSFDEMITDAQKLRAGPYDRAGQWDLAMILDHLGKSMNMPFAGGKNLPWPATVIGRFVLHRFAQRTTYPMVKFPAPKGIRPISGIELEPAFTEFLTAARRVEDASDETIQWPPFGRILLEDFRKIQLLHGAHHLSFLKLRDAAA